MKYEKAALFQFTDIVMRLGSYDVALDYLSHAVPSNPWDVKIHSHSGYEMHFITSGSGRLSTLDKTYELTSGYVVVTGPNVIHSQSSGKDKPMEEYCIRVSFTPRRRGSGSETLDRLIESVIENPFFYGRYDFDVAEVFGEMLSEADRRPTAFRENIGHLAAYILIRLGRVISGCGGSAFTAAGEPINYRNRLDETFYQCPSADISPDEIAHRLRISRRQLSRVFRDCYGMTFTEKVSNLRVEYAKQLLITTDLPVGEISDRVGFKNQQYFTQVFRKITRITPKNWRENARSDKQ